MATPHDRARLVELDKRYVWHPYTAMDEYIAEGDPLVIERAEGARLYDVDGRVYLDGNASWWVATLGHNHPRLVRALQDQAARLAHTALAGITHEPVARLAEAICAVAPPGLERVFFSDDGSTAVEVALKMALQYWAQNGQPERRRFVALEGAFHGETLGVTALGGVEVFRRPFAGTGVECLHVPSPGDPKVTTEEAVAALEAALEQYGPTIAALVLEPLVQGAAGMRIYAPEYLRAARRLCDRHGILLVLDEVFTGYGRTGTMWACEQAGIAPDLLCTAKGFSGGMLPMAATLVTDRIFRGFLGGAERTFFYGHSFCGNPLGAAVALEVLRVFEEEEVLARAGAKAKRIARTFAELGSWPGVAHARWLGMVGALDLEGEEGYLARAGWEVAREARRRGAYLRPLGNVVYVTPALTIPDSDLDRLLEIVAESVRAVLEQGGRHSRPPR